MMNYFQNIYGFNNVNSSIGSCYLKFHLHTHFLLTKRKYGLNHEEKSTLGIFKTELVCTNKSRYNFLIYNDPFKFTVEFQFGEKFQG